MRFISADYIFPVSSPPIKNGVIAVHDDGSIDDVLTPQGFEQLQTSNLKPETYNGIICPGFINSHCHLELSHLKGKLAESKRLPHFIGNIVARRQENKEIILEAVEKAEEEMIRHGIVAVGDICNTTDTIPQKRLERMRYHNFIEIFDLHEARARQSLENGKKLFHEFRTLTHSCSLTPHAPYTVSKQLLLFINKFNLENVKQSLVTIHNQETASEEDMFRHRRGELLEKLRSFGDVHDDWLPLGQSSAFYAHHMFEKGKVMLVHNTYTHFDEMSVVSAYARATNKNEIYWCFCPNSNLFIENHLPDFSQFIKEENILIGTDSYASNWSLSILDEMKTIQKNAPQIKLEEMITWATLNGAEFFNWDKELGSIEKGKRPGLNLITNITINEEALSLTDQSQVKPLLN